MMQKIRVELSGCENEDGHMMLPEACAAKLGRMLRSGLVVQIAGGIVIDKNDHVISITLAPQPVEPRIAPHTEVEVDGSRVAYNPSTSDRLAYVAMKLGTARVLMSQNAMDATCQVIDDACNYIREAACDKGTK